MSRRASTKGTGMMRTRSLVVRLFAASLLVLIGAGPACAKVSSIRQLRSQLEKASSSWTRHQRELRQIKKQQRSAIQNLAVAEHTLVVNRANWREIRRQLLQTQKTVAATQASIRLIRKRLNRQNDLLASRLIDTYKHGSIGYLDVVLGSATFSDLLERGVIIRKVMNSDAELIESIRKDKQEMEEQHAMLKDQEARRAGLERQHASLTRQAYSTTKEREGILRDINTKRAEYEAMVAADIANTKAIESMIRSMQKTPSGRRRFNTVWRGSFMRPVNGTITCPFGPRIHPIFKTASFHTGVDIGAPSGTPIVAAAAGEVIEACWNSIYGNMVIIDHGGGMTTLYGHCSRFAVHKGSIVKKGQTIACVGNTGWSTGPHLHFQVMRNGEPINPTSN